MEISQKWLSLKDTNSGICFCYLLPKREEKNLKNGKYLDFWNFGYQNDNFEPMWILSDSKRQRNGNPKSVKDAT
jgi:hypothetical protein